MTADRLDAETEARIREACPRHRIDPEASETFALPAYACYCSIQRAAIKADREARQPRYNNIIATRLRIEGECKTERAHADALAEALRTEVEMHSALTGREPETCARCGFSYPCGFVQHALPLLAAHDKRRGR